MRFLQDGPNIPDELLWARDKGNVVFLCGAGISMPSGLPSFWQLTKYVIDKISPSPESDIAKAFAPWVDGSPESERVHVAARIPFDQIFNLLIQSIGKEAVDAHVSEKLSSVDITKVSYEHELLTRLSANENGAPQLVTTNFDCLFDSVENKNKVRNHLPPMFPNLSHSGVDATGITYLHGRLSDKNTTQSDFVLSSSDFGRAYLAEGWATNFIRNLLRRYTVVLVGYSAEDPPVKYLLQGLAASNLEEKTNLYAFDKGTEDSVRDKWKDRGVRTISYQGNNHDALWATLDCWASRADSVIDWQKSIICLAQKDPKSLEKHERGMVTHLVSSSIGAFDFANAMPPPSAEWLCVFDVHCRYSEPYDANRYGFKENNGVDIEPLELYGLDEDPMRPESGRDYIGWLNEDGSNIGNQRLAGDYVSSGQSIPARLRHLNLWLSTQIESPILVWWIARQYSIHESLKRLLRQSVNQSDSITDSMRKVWDILFRGIDDFELSTHGAEWYSFMRRFKREDWSQSVIWELENCLTSKIKVTKTLGKLKSAPIIDVHVSEIKIRDLAKVEVVSYQLYGMPPVIPSNMLVKIVTIVQQSLIRTIDILNWVDQPYWERTVVNNRTETGEFSGSGDVGDILAWFNRIFNELAIYQPEEARALVEQWPKNDPEIFNKLKIDIFNSSNLFKKDEIASRLIQMGLKKFWSYDYKNELLYLLRDNYNSFSKENKSLIFNELASPREIVELDKSGMRPVTQYYQSVISIEWLRQNGVLFDGDVLLEIDKLKKSLPDWRDDLYKSAVDFDDLSLATVFSNNENCDALNQCLVSEIISLAKNNTISDYPKRIDYAPFRGLVKTNQKRAFFALSYAAREGVYPSIFWQNLLSEWSSTIGDNGTFLLGRRIFHLPSVFILELRYEIAIWLGRNFKELYFEDNEVAIRSLDRYLNLVTGDLNFDSIDSCGHIREVTQGIIGLCTENETDRKLVALLYERLELLINMPIEGRKQVLRVLADNSQWIFKDNKEWFKRLLFPYFDLEKPGALENWGGLLKRHHWHHVQDFAIELKPFLLKLLKNIVNHNDKINSSSVFVFLIESCIFSDNHTVVMEYKEVKDCLRYMNEEMRISFIEKLKVVGRDFGWKEYVIPFIENAWPIEKTYFSSNVSSAWIQLLDDTGEYFSEVFSVIRNFLVPIAHRDIGLYRFHSNLGEQSPAIASKFPEEVLDMLLAIVSPKVNYNLRGIEQVLNTVIEAKPELEKDMRYSKLKKVVAEY